MIEIGDEMTHRFAVLDSAHGMRTDRRHFILDTNVVSAFTTVIRRGVNLAKPEHERVIDFVRNFDPENESISTDLAALEAAGLRNGSLSPREAWRCLVLPYALCHMDPVAREEWILSGEPMAAVGSPSYEINEHLEELFENADQSVISLVGISYAIVAALHGVVDRPWREVADQALGILSELNYVPPRVAAFVGLAVAGTPQIRAKIRDRILKVSKQDKATVLYSAAVDLSLLTLAKYVEVRGESASVVTSDRGLVEFAELLDGSVIGDRIDAEAFDQQRVDEWDAIYSTFAMQRLLFASPEIPDADQVEQIVRRTAEGAGLPVARFTRLAVVGEHCGSVEVAALYPWVQGVAFGGDAPPGNPQWAFEVLESLPSPSVDLALTAVCDVFSGVVELIRGHSNRETDEVLNDVVQMMYSSNPEFDEVSKTPPNLGPFSLAYAYYFTGARGQLLLRVASHDELLDSADNALVAFNLGLLLLRAAAVRFADAAGVPQGDTLRALESASISFGRENSEA